MNRMSCVAWTGILFMLLLMSGGCVDRKSPRNSIPLNQGWRFVREDVSGAQAIRFDDRRWQKVSIPHTWNGLDGQDGGGNYYRGAGWYRRKLSIPKQAAGKSIFLRFDGASLVTNAYVNGQSVGEHRGGYGAFCFDITTLVRPGNNTLAVRVDNGKFPDIAPLSGDFTVSGGLYRNVHLLVLEPLSVSPMDDASPGVYLKQTHVTRAHADIEVLTKLRNAYASDQTATIHCTIADAKGAIVATTVGESSVPRYGQSDSVLRLAITNPRLWDGTRDPHLYRARVEVRRAGKVVDRVVQPLGLRFYSVDPEAGFFLNDRRYPLHGVNVHQDWPNKGYAIWPREIDQNYKLIRELGCTLVRMAHYQHPDYEYSLCDRAGLVVWAELALVNQIEKSPEFDANAKQQLRELIKQNFNHPSIAFWSIFNELSFGRRDSQSYSDPENWKLVDELNDLAHKLDGTRLTTAASHLDDNHPSNWITDTTAFNRYWGWYSGTFSDWARRLDSLHEQFPQRAVAISEYGAGASIRHHQVYPTSQPFTTGKWHPEEWQALFHENVYGVLKRRPWLWGTMIWVMFDFASDGRKEGDTAGINDKGLITHDRKTRKDAFYFYKANWTPKPLVHITSRRFNPRPAGSTTLKVYSNCDAVELFLNGKSLGRRTGKDCVFVWENVTLNEKRAEVRAVGEKDGKSYKDAVKFTVSRAAPTTQMTEVVRKKRRFIIW